jgi:hypothetical protein
MGSILLPESPYSIPDLAMRPVGLSDDVDTVRVED